MKKYVRCFYIIRVQKKYMPGGRKKKQERLVTRGHYATVHAHSQADAMKILEAAGYPAHMYRVLPNTSCDPEQLPPGWHCSNYLLLKHNADFTPLGSVQPNSPEWNERYGQPKRGISPHRLARIESHRQRKDVGDG